MSLYLVKFYKKVTGDNGRVVDACQWWLETPAADRKDAETIAKRRFCETRHLPDWSLHADRVQVIEADFPS